MPKLLHSRDHCSSLPPGSEGTVGTSCRRNDTPQLKRQVLLRSGNHLAMPACKEGELGPLIWDCLEEQKDDRDRASRMKLSLIVSCLLLSRKVFQRWATICLKGLKKLRGICHTHSIGLNKLLLQAEFIAHELHPGSTEKGAAKQRLVSISA